MAKLTHYSINWCCPDCGSFEMDKETEGKSLEELFCGECGSTFHLDNEELEKAQEQLECCKDYARSNPMSAPQCLLYLLGGDEDA